jgi:hypothetical protein
VKIEESTPQMKIKERHCPKRKVRNSRHHRNEENTIGHEEMLLE